ncbi:MAG: LysM peptidoglycan-binding domain-containing protein [Spirochaetales bacterium]|nr:LysM peptidoglycan-binding domain-containing protein [Spirochaetales bacterium]
MKNTYYAFLILMTALLLFSGCGSEPEPVEEPVEEPAVVTPDETAPDVDSAAVVEDPVDLSFLDDAEAALLKAGEAGAAEFHPDRFNNLIVDLEEIKVQSETDPEGAKSASDALIAAADELYRDSLSSAREYFGIQMDKMDEVLLAMEADKYAPKSWELTVVMREDVEARFDSEDYSGAQFSYRETMTAKQSLKEGLENNISWIDILIRDTEMYLADAEELEAFLWAEEELEQADELLEEGRGLYKAYDLKGAESSLLQAKVLARQIAEGGGRMQQINQTDSLMVDVMEAIEKASRMTVVDEDGNIIDPDPWDGDEFLEENPLTELENDIEVEEEESNLQDYVPTDGTTGVMGEDEEEDNSYLLTAQKLWEKGVEARNAENLELANEYFHQARIFVEAYQSNAVSDFYTVVGRKVDTDCLWRISEYDSIYGNPFLWPKIWRRNKKTIQNPDLIFPGQVLIIPPK